MHVDDERHRVRHGRAAAGEAAIVGDARDARHGRSPLTPTLSPQAGRGSGIRDARDQRPRSPRTAGASAEFPRACAGPREQPSPASEGAPCKGGPERGEADRPTSPRHAFQRGQLAVDDAADRQQLRAIEIARQRVAAVLVDPVVDADAVLERVPERGLAGPARPACGPAASAAACPGSRRRTAPSAARCRRRGVRRPARSPAGSGPARARRNPRRFDSQLTSRFSSAAQISTGRLTSPAYSACMSAACRVNVVGVPSRCRLASRPNQPTATPMTSEAAAAADSRATRGTRGRAGAGPVAAATRRSGGGFGEPRIERVAQRGVLRAQVRDALRERGIARDAPPRRPACARARAGRQRRR